MPPLMYKLFLAAVFAASAGALPSDLPEVIPGPGLPSLASLNLTSADLYTPVDPKTISTPLLLLPLN
jgi:hypothetical protein